MKRAFRLILATMIFVVASVPAVVLATPSDADQLIALGMSPVLAKKLVQVVNTLASPFSNNTWITVRNAANGANINVLKVDGSDETVLNADSGDTIKLAIAGTAEFTVGGDSLAYTVATAGTPFFGTSSVDAADDNTLSIASAAAALDSRGGFVSLLGNEVATVGGGIDLTAGNASTAHVDVNLEHSASTFNVKDTTSGTMFTVTDAGAVTAAGQFTSTGLNFPAANFETVAGAGSTVSDAAALSATKHVHQITGANGTLGWKFASATAGQFEVLLNTTAGVAKIYAVSGGTCNGGATDAACTLLSGIAPHICYATAASTWICS